MEYKETYNPMNDKKVLILIGILLLLTALIIILHKLDLIKSLEIIVPDLR